MKKIIGLLIVVAMVFSVGCSLDEEVSDDFREYEVMELNPLEEFFINLDIDMGYEEYREFVLNSDFEIDGDRGYSTMGESLTIGHPEVEDTVIILYFEKDERVYKALYDETISWIENNRADGVKNFFQQNFKVSLPIETKRGQEKYSLDFDTWGAEDEDSYTYRGEHICGGLSDSNERDSVKAGSREELVQYMQYRKRTHVCE